MKVSAFCLTTNSIKYQFPFIESIKSWLNVVDELVVVDGGSTDGTIEAIVSINDPKIRIISDSDTKWEDDWYYSRMGHNCNRGLNECSGDWVLKFDVDWILHENSYMFNDRNFTKDLVQALDGKKECLAFNRLNVLLADRYHVKSKKTLGINRQAEKINNVKIVWGLDLNGWGWGFEPVVYKYEKDGIMFGDMIRHGYNSMIPHSSIFNYDGTFKTKEVLGEARQRHVKAIARQEKLMGLESKFSLETLEKYPNYGMEEATERALSSLKERFVERIKLEQHPAIIQDKIKNLTPEQQGYNMFGLYDTADYFK